MPAKDKSLAVMLLLLALGLGGAGCSLQTPRGFPEDSESRVVTAEDGGKEEVLSGDDDEDGFGRRASRPETAGEFVVVLGYIGMLVGSAILPFLLL